MGGLTKAQRALLVRMGSGLNSLRNGDEHTPRWWIDGKAGVKANVAESILLRGYASLTGKWGGQLGVLGFTINPAGRAALAEGEKA